MIFKYETKKIGDKHYLKGHRLVNEYGAPDGILEYSNPPQLDLLDENNKLQYIVETIDDKITFTLSPQVLTLDESEIKRETEVIKEISTTYTMAEEVKLIKQALKAAFGLTGILPQAYLDMEATIAQIKTDSYDGY